MNPVVILVELFTGFFKLAMKTPAWAVKWIILPIFTVLVGMGLVGTIFF